MENQIKILEKRIEKLEAAWQTNQILYGFVQYMLINRSQEADLLCKLFEAYGIKPEDLDLSKANYDFNFAGIKSYHIKK